MKVVSRSVFVKTLLCLFLLVALPRLVLAERVTLDNAKRAAWRVLSQKAQRQGKALQSRKAENLRIWREASAEQAAHVIADARGSFAVIAADDRLPQVLAYGEGATEAAMPVGLQQLLLHYDRQWSQMMTLTHRPMAADEDNYVPIEPFLNIIRHQKAPFNGACPYYTNDEGKTSEERTVVGCVATAMEQIMTYYGRNVVLKDTLRGWQTSHYKIADVPAGTVVLFDSIKADYRGGYTPAEAEAVAQVAYLCGVTAKMSWGLRESGTTLTAPIDNLKRAWGYAYVHYLDSYLYAPRTWWQMICRELQARRPVLYAAGLMRLGAHAFVIDGMDSAGRVHIDWGFGGDYNGYFRLSVLNPFQEYDTTPTDELMGMAYNHEAIFLHPDAQDALPDTLERTGKEIIVDSLVFHRTPTAFDYSPATLYVRNGTGLRLTTPFAIFTNAPEDSVAFEQGLYAAITGATLAPYESKALTVYLSLRRSGQRILRITPDNKAIIYEDTLTVPEFAAPQLAFQLNELQALPTAVRALLHIRNLSDATPVGALLTYSLFEGSVMIPETDWRHYAFADVAPHEAKTDTIVFNDLKPNTTYTLLVRYPWLGVAQQTFTTPDAVTNIAAVGQTEDGHGSLLYDLQGRKVKAVRRGEVCIEGKTKVMAQ